MSIEWRGVMPAVTTKFTDNDQLDLKMFEKISKHNLMQEFMELYWEVLWVKLAPY